MPLQVELRIDAKGFVFDPARKLWLPPLNQKQLEIFNEFHRYLLVHGPRKCVERGTFVWTPEGQKRIEDFKIGDVVIGFDGLAQIRSEVVGIGPTDKRLGYQLEGEAGHRIRCSSDHPIWCCHEVKGEVQFTYLPAEEIANLISAGSAVWSPVLQSNESVSYGTCASAPTSLSGYWLGAMTGDGTCRTDGGRRLGFTNSDSECVALVSSYAASAGSELVKLKAQYGFSYRNSSALVEIIRTHGLSCNSPQKRIPAQILAGPLDVAQSYLMGLFDTDGFVSSDGKQVSLTSASEGLIRDAHQLLARLGVFGRIHSRHHTCTNAPMPHREIYWHVQIYGEDVARFAASVGSAITRKRERLVAFRPSTSTRAVKFGIPPIICSHIRRLSKCAHSGCGFRKTGRTRAWHRQRRWLNSSMLYRPSLRKLALVREVFQDDEVLRLFSASSRWVEWKTANPIESEFWDIGVEGCDSFIVSGVPNHNSGKTFGILHKVIRHSFDVKGAMAAIVTKTIKNAKAAGVWMLLTRMLKVWEAGCPGFRVVEGPKTMGDTKMSFVRIRNRHGTISEIQCHSLEHSAEVEAKFKGPAYSLFWLSEFDQYCDEHAFDIFCDALRMWPDVTYEEHQIIADCNPPDTGTNNWIHDKWFKFKNAEASKDADADHVESDKLLRASLHQILVMLDDNPQLDPRERKDIEGRYRKRKSLYSRFILGKWEQDITDGHFSDVWNEDIHVVGSADGSENEWEVMVPTAGCRELICGWDIGEMKSHSFHIMEKLTLEDTATKRLVVSFNVLDELIVVKQYVSVEDFVIACVEKMDHWEKWQLKRNNIALSWRHWSDTSAFDKRASSNNSDAAIAYGASRARVVLQGAPKYRESNKDKVNLIWQFLHAKRLHVSAQLFRTRAMFAMLRADPKSSQSKFVKRDDHKHPFDSLSYPIIAEAPIDMLQNAEVDIASKDGSPRPIFASL